MLQCVVQDSLECPQLAEESLPEADCLQSDFGELVCLEAALLAAHQDPEWCQSEFVWDWERKHATG